MIRFTRDVFEAADIDITIEDMPLYGIERAAGLATALPTSDVTVQFRVKDDDGVECARGLLDDDDEAANQQAALRYAETAWGCTTIEVLRGRDPNDAGGWRAEIG